MKYIGKKGKYRDVEESVRGKEDKKSLGFL